MKFGVVCLQGKLKTDCKEMINRIQYLDGLRAISIIMVLIGHGAHSPRASLQTGVYHSAVLDCIT